MSKLSGDPSKGSSRNDGFSSIDLSEISQGQSHLGELPRGNNYRAPMTESSDGPETEFISSLTPNSSGRNGVPTLPIWSRTPSLDGSTHNSIPSMSEISGTHAFFPLHIGVNHSNDRALSETSQSMTESQV